MKRHGQTTCNLHLHQQDTYLITTTGPTYQIKFKIYTYLWVNNHSLIIYRALTIITPIALSIVSNLCAQYTLNI